MQNKEQAHTFLINPALTLEEKTALVNNELQRNEGHGKWEQTLNEG